MKKYRSYIAALLVLIAGAGLLLNKEKASNGHDDPGINITISEPDFDRTLRPLIFTKHAKCRMACRHIDDSEIEDILVNGNINYDKTDIHSKPDPKYALEGKTRDNQQVRVIFAPSKKGMVVITCIDLDMEWSCNCK